MRKNVEIILLISLILSLFLIGCTTSNSIVGSWFEKDGTHWYTFREDGSFQGPDSWDTGSWEIKDGKLIIYHDSGFSQTYIKFDVNGDVLTLEAPGTGIPYRVYRK